MKKQIIYIVSDVRSGSTLLENVLSFAPNTVSVGELSLLASFLYKGDVGRHVQWKCTCGADMECCNFWADIILRLKKRGITIGETSSHILERVKNKNLVNSTELNEVIIGNDEIYKEIFQATGTTSIIDSSKRVDQGVALYKLSSHKVKIIYIKRDLRAVSVSKYKWSLKFNSKAISPTRLLIRSLRVRTRINTAIKNVDADDLICIRYEDFAKDPQTAIDQITKKFNLISYLVPGYMDLRARHSIGGTPNRYAKVPIEYDSKWEEFTKKRPIFNIAGKVFELIS